MKILKYNVVWTPAETKPKPRKPITPRVERLPPRAAGEKKTMADWGFSKPENELTQEEYTAYLRVRNADYYRRNADKVAAISKRNYAKRKAKKLVCDALPGEGA